jgi:limonene-1,2-epoxide hydrolase
MLLSVVPNYRTMTPNEQVINTFYQAFQYKDYKTMQTCYADTAVFNDEVFINLNAAEVRAMWEMLCKKGKDLELVFSNVTSTEKTGSADWTATYSFSKTDRKVINRIHASFEFSNGKIIKHTDQFDFYTWARQALGITGSLLGWSNFLKNKIQKDARKNLLAFMESKKK